MLHLFIVRCDHRGRGDSVQRHERNCVPQKVRTRSRLFHCRHYSVCTVLDVRRSHGEEGRRVHRNYRHALHHSLYTRCDVFDERSKEPPGLWSLLKLPPDNREGRHNVYRYDRHRVRHEMCPGQHVVAERARCSGEVCGVLGVYC